MIEILAGLYCMAGLILGINVTLLASEPSNTFEAVVIATLWPLFFLVLIYGLVVEMISILKGNPSKGNHQSDISHSRISEIEK
jgi:hypothetical protein